MSANTLCQSWKPMNQIFADSIPSKILTRRSLSGILVRFLACSQVTWFLLEPGRILHLFLQRVPGYRSFLEEQAISFSSEAARI